MNRVLLCLATVAALARPAAAQPSEEELQRAVILFEESERLYNAGDFEEAAGLLRRAYEITPDATLLFNLARALEGGGDLNGAIETYERYLREAEDVPDRGAVERRVSTLREQRDRLASSARPEDEPEEPIGSPVHDDTESPSPAGWIVAAGGAVLVITGAVLGLVSNGLESDAANEPVMTEAVDLHDSAETFALLANVFLIGGGVVAAAGLTWGIISLTRSSSNESAVRLTPSLGGLVLSGRF